MKKAAGLSLAVDGYLIVIDVSEDWRRIYECEL